MKNDKVKIGDVVTFKRYGMLMSGTVTYVFENRPNKVMVDRIHYVDTSKIIKVKK